MKLMKIFATGLIFALLAGALPASAFATTVQTEKSVGSKALFTPTAEIMPVYGAARAIVSLTFDDAVYTSALVVEELCEKYDLKASMMMWCERIGMAGSDYATAETWAKLFAKGYLEPQNHSMTHMDLRSYTEGGKANQTEENFQNEIVESKKMLEELFPEYDFLTYAIPYGAMSAAASQLALQHHYALRSVSNEIQSLNPTFGTGSGSWGSLYSPKVVGGANEEEQIAFLKAWVDRAVNEGGWYTPYIHRVGNASGAEMTYRVTEEYFKYISAYQESGDVWVATFSDATKYVRERQNTTASVRYSGGKVYVKLDMAEKTQDNLPLSKDVFNHPLTVKVKVPSSFESACCRTKDGFASSTMFTEGDETYIYVDVVPNGEEVEIGTEHELDSFAKKDADSHTATCGCGYEELQPHDVGIYGYCEDCEVGISKISLSLGSTLSLNYYVCIDESTLDGDPEISMKFTKGAEKLTVGKYEKREGLYVFTLDGISPDEMSDTISAELLIDGKISAAKLSYSAQKYCKDALKIYPNDTSLCTLISDLLIYANAFEKSIDGSSAIGAGLTLTPSEHAPAEKDNVKSIAGNDNEKLFIDSVSMNFRVQASLAFKIYAEEDDFTVIITSPKSGLTVIYTKGQLDDMGGGYFSAYSRALSPSDFASDVVAKIIDKDGLTVAEYTYTYNTYAYEASINPSLDTDEKALATALYRFGKSFEDYKNK